MAIIIWYTVPVQSSHSAHATKSKSSFPGTQHRPRMRIFWSKEWYLQSLFGLLFFNFLWILLLRSPNESFYCCLIGKSVLLSDLLAHIKLLIHFILIYILSSKLVHWLLYRINFRVSFSSREFRKLEGLIWAPWLANRFDEEFWLSEDRPIVDGRLWCYRNVVLVHLLMLLIIFWFILETFLDKKVFDFTLRLIFNEYSLCILHQWLIRWDVIVAVLVAASMCMVLSS